MDNGWSTGQIRQENAARNRTFRLPTMQETIPSCPKQTKDLERLKRESQDKNKPKKLEA